MYSLLIVDLIVPDLQATKIASLKLKTGDLTADLGLVAAR
jgi:hypothetical protein